MSIIKLADLANYVNKQAISGVEGVITKVYDAKTGTKNAFTWHIQGAVMVDNDQVEHRINFTHASVAQPKSIEGKRFRITPASGKPESLSFKEATMENGAVKYAPEVQVGAGCKIEQIGGVSPAGAQSTEKNQSSQGKHNPSNEPTYKVTSLSERMEEFWKVYDACMPNMITHGFTKEQVLEQARWFANTYKAQYGTYAPPAFEVKPKWREFYSESKKKPLGELSTEEMQPIAVWALTKPKQEKEYNENLRLAGIEAAKELGWTPWVLVDEHMKAHIPNYDPSHLKFHMEKDGMTGTEEDWKQCLSNLKALTELIHKAHQDVQATGDDSDVPP